jgi:hypothetical protein
MAQGSMRKLPKFRDRFAESWSKRLVRHEGYERRIVAFYDVLGWRAKVKDAGDDPRAVAQLRYLVGLYAVIEKLAFGTKRAHVRATSFSDNIVISERVEEDNIPWFLMCLGMVQLVSAMDGHFIRGGVTIGKIVHNRFYVFGPGLNRAYELESNVARYPRIILDRKIIAEFGKLPFFVKFERGIYFIDPFDPLFFGYIFESVFRDWNAKVNIQWFTRGAQSPQDIFVLFMTRIMKSLEDQLRSRIGWREWEKLEWLYERVLQAFGLKGHAIYFRRIPSGRKLSRAHRTFLERVSKLKEDTKLSRSPSTSRRHRLRANN